MYVIGNILNGLVVVLDSVLFIYTIIIIASVVISWVNADPTNQIVRIIRQLTEPVFKKIRKKIPTNFGGLDFAPIIVLLIVMFIESGILPSIAHFAKTLSM